MEWTEPGDWLPGQLEHQVMEESYTLRGRREKEEAGEEVKQALPQIPPAVPVSHLSPKLL